MDLLLWPDCATNSFGRLSGLVSRVLKPSRRCCQPHRLRRYSSSVVAIEPRRIVKEFGLGIKPSSQIASPARENLRAWTNMKGVTSESSLRTSAATKRFHSFLTVWRSSYHLKEAVRSSSIKSRFLQCLLLCCFLSPFIPRYSTTNCHELCN